MTKLTASYASGNELVIDTNGWDTVYAIYYPAVNRAIKIQKSSPQNGFEQEAADDGLKYSGTFGDWQLTTGGAGHNVNMVIPVASSTFSGLGKEIALDPIEFTSQVNLDWVAHPDDPEFNQVLKVKPGSGEHEIPKITILDGVNWGDNENKTSPDGKKLLTTIVKASIKQLLGDWLKDHADAFQHTFAALNIDKQIGEKGGAFAWLKPTDTSYAVAEIEKDNHIEIEKSVFAVLCMTENRASPGVQQTSPVSIPEGVNSSFVIRASRLLDEFLLPGIHLMFDGATKEDFEVNYLNGAISNKNRLTFQEQELDLVDLPTDYADIERHVKPQVDPGNFSIVVMDTYLELKFIDLYFNIMPGMTCHLTHTSRAALRINEKRQMQISVNEEEGGFETHVSVTTSTAYDIISIASTIALSIAGSIAGGFIGGAISKGGSAAASEVGTAAATIATEAATMAAADATSNITGKAIGGAASEAAAAALGKAPQVAGKFSTMLVRQWPKILGSIIGGTIGVAIGEIPKVLEMIEKDSADDDMPLTLEALVGEALSPIEWPNLSTEGFEIKNGILNGAFAIGINLKEV